MGFISYLIQCTVKLILINTDIKLTQLKVISNCMISFLGTVFWLFEYSKLDRLWIKMLDNGTLNSHIEFGGKYNIVFATFLFFIFLSKNPIAPHSFISGLIDLNLEMFWPLIVQCSLTPFFYFVFSIQAFYQILKGHRSWILISLINFFRNYHDYHKIYERTYLLLIEIFFLFLWQAK